jgi:hypothetical protein
VHKFPGILEFSIADANLIRKFAKGEDTAEVSVIAPKGRFKYPHYYRDAPISCAASQPNRHNTEWQIKKHKSEQDSSNGGY